MNNLTIVFAMVGTLAGVIYSVLGIVALKHLTGATEVDKAVGWTLWWFLESKRYDTEGKRLCQIGGWIFVVGALAWLVCAFGLKR